jgi:hypothetical protein
MEAKVNLQMQRFIRSDRKSRKPASIGQSCKTASYSTENRCNNPTVKYRVTENWNYYIWYCLHSRSMRFRPISVWLSTTPDVAESHKINTQSTCLRQLIKVSLLFAHSLELHEEVHYAPPMSASVRERAYGLTIFDGAPETFGGPAEWGWSLEWLAMAPMGVSACHWILYASKLTYRL